MKLIIPDIESFPKGEKLTRCYHCGHEGELTDAHYPGLCVDRVACGERLAARRPDGINPVLANRETCAREGHCAGLENRRCVSVNTDGSPMSLVEKLGNLGHNAWEVWQGCARCGEVLVSMAYREDETLGAWRRKRGGAEAGRPQEEDQPSTQ